MQAGTQPAEPKYRRLSAAERDQIANMKAAGHSNAEIARATGRNDGTITRELQRNSSPTNPSPRPAPSMPYLAAQRSCTAPTRLTSRRARERWGIAHATRSRTSFCAATSRKSSAGCGGRQRDRRPLRHEFGKCYERNLCAETIYEWIYSDDAPTDLRTLLPRKRRQRGNATGAASAPASARSQTDRDRGAPRDRRDPR